MSRRPRIPAHIERRVLYGSAYACAICQTRTVQIHHVDYDHSNNTPENLIVLCQIHHGEAHTKRNLTISLTPERLRYAKAKWEMEVHARRAKVASVGYQRAAAGDFLGAGVSWGYINHRRVASLLNNDILSKINQNNFETCQTRGLVDRNGLIIPRNNSKPRHGYLNSSIYDQFGCGDDHRIHKLYSEMVDAISQSCDPIHITDESFSKTWIRQFVDAGSFLFVNRGHYFRDIENQGDNIVRLAYTFKRRIQFEYIVETKDMFGVSSMTVSFVGRSTSAAFSLVKSVQDDEKLTIHCTPLALGTGYWPLSVYVEPPMEESPPPEDPNQTFSLLVR